MADYKGKLNLIAEKVYLGNTYGQITADEEPSNIICDISIPNIKNIGLERFDVKYVTGRTSGTQDTTRPYYIWTGDKDVVPIQFPNIKDFTWIIPDDMGGILGISDVSGTTNYLSSGVFADMYNNTYPHYDNPYRLAWAYDGVGQSNGMSMKAKHAYAVGIDKNVNEFHGLKSDTTNIGEGYIISPYSVRTLYGYSNYSFMSFKSNGDLAMVGRPLRISESYGSPSYTRRLGQVCRFDIIGKDNTTRTVRIPFVYHTGGGIYLIPSDSGEQMNFFTFLIDDDMQLWFMTYSLRSATYHTQNDVTICITKVDNVVEDVSYGTGAWNFFNSNVYYVDEEQFGSINEFFLDMLSPEKNVTPDFDDNGPDIVGPGDAYEGDSNAGSSVGGNSNLNPDITLPNISPNFGYDSFVSNAGLFGCYNLTNDNIKNYAKTLKILQDNEWRTGELGDQCENMANLIRENTISLFMLPVLIKNDDCSLEDFNVGTKGIRTTDTLESYVSPDSVDKAKLIKVMTSSDEVELGTISHYYDNFLDFYPYSTASLYIPYIGKVELPINLIQSTSTVEKQLKLTFRINRANGDLLVILLVDEIPICRWNGNCAKNIPLSVNDNSGILQNQMSRVVNTLTSTVGAIASFATGNVPQGIVGAAGAAYSYLTPGSPINTSSHLIGKTPESGDIGWMDSQNIILTVERPVWWKPYDYGGLIGYPTRKIAKLSSIKGFAKVSDIHLRCSATESEKERLKTMLAEGCIF